ncbi:unnamed protein product [Camellia sinensis]
MLVCPLSLSLCSLSQSVPTLCSSPKSLTTIAHVRRTSPPPEITIALCLMDSSFLEDPHPISPHLRPTSHATASATAAAASSRMILILRYDFDFEEGFSRFGPWFNPLFSSNLISICKHACQSLASRRAYQDGLHSRAI